MPLETLGNGFNEAAIFPKGCVFTGCLGKGFCDKEDALADNWEGICVPEDISVGLMLRCCRILEFRPIALISHLLQRTRTAA